MLSSDQNRTLKGGNVKFMYLTFTLFFLLSAQLYAQTTTDYIFSEEKLNEVVIRTLQEESVSGQEIQVQSKNKMFDWKFLSVAGILHGSMILDLNSTYYTLNRCPSCKEANPYTAPFVNKGPACAYVAATIFQGGLMYLSHRMRYSKDPVIRKIWTVLPLLTASTHIVLANHNYKLGKQVVRQ
jgi:hypothetical protein